MTSPADIVALLEAVAPVCKRLGIHRLSAGTVEIEFAAPASKVDPAAMKAFNEFLDKGLPGDEEVLFHSAPDGPPPRPEAPQPQPPPVARNRGA